MPDIETLVAEWRARLTTAMPGRLEAVQELEEHLRDEIAAFQERGMAPAEAFAQASARLGEAGALSREFRRTQAGWTAAGGVGERALAYAAGALGLGGGMYFIVALSWFLTRVMHGKPGNPHRPDMPLYWAFHALMLVALCALAVRASGRFLRQPARAEARSIAAFFLFATWLLGANGLAVTHFSYACKVSALLVALGGIVLLWRVWTAAVMRRDFPAATTYE